MKTLLLAILFGALSINAFAAPASSTKLDITVFLVQCKSIFSNPIDVSQMKVEINDGVGEQSFLHDVEDQNVGGKIKTNIIRTNEGLVIEGEYLQKNKTEAQAHMWLIPAPTSGRGVTASQCFPREDGNFKLTLVYEVVK